jgi:hypothetical protein
LRVVVAVGDSEAVVVQAVCVLALASLLRRDLLTPSQLEPVVMVVLLHQKRRHRPVVTQSLAPLHLLVAVAVVLTTTSLRTHKHHLWVLQVALAAVVLLMLPWLLAQEALETPQAHLHHKEITAARGLLAALADM